MIRVVDDHLLAVLAGKRGHGRPLGEGKFGQKQGALVKFSAGKGPSFAALDP